MINLTKALLKCQKSIHNAQKDSSNPHFKNRYASLESVIDAVKTIANENGIVIAQGNGHDEHGPYASTTVFHADSGESITSKVFLVLEKPNMQGLGSAITYARRYGLAAMFAIGQDDDDGNHASQPKASHKVNAVESAPWSTPIKPSSVVVNTNAVNLDAYVIQIGKKFKGKTFPQVYDEVGGEGIRGYVEWIKKNAKDNGKEIHKNDVDFIEKAERFLADFENSHTVDPDLY